LLKFEIDPEKPLPQSYVNDFRDMAVKFEQQGDISAAKKLMLLAHSGRPEGPFIKNKLDEYNTILPED
jgi:hypothetical protein